MNQSRRDLLKYFAAGTVIAPVAGAAPLAKLIEVPKIEIVEAKALGSKIDLTKVESISIHFKMTDGTIRTLNPEWFSGVKSMWVSHLADEIDLNYNWTMRCDWSNGDLHSPASRPSWHGQFDFGSGGMYGL